MTKFKSPEQQALSELGLGSEAAGAAPLVKAPVEFVDGTPPKDPAANLQPFSFGWMLASMGVFAAFQVGLAFLAGQSVFSGGYLTANMRYFVEGMINLLSYFLSGLVIGVVSPRLRVFEPAVAAAVVVVATLSVGLYTPSTLMAMGPLKLLIGGGLAFFLALWGSTLGERLTRQI